MATTSVHAGGGVALGGEATVAFINGAPEQVPSDIVVQWDFDNDGDFSEAVEDITPYVLAATARIGRDFPSQLSGEASPGELRLTLDNSDDRFSVLNSSSPLNTGVMSLKTGRRIQVRDVDTPDPEPTRLARDRFLGGDGPLATDELGGTWENPTGYAFHRRDQAATAEASYAGDAHVSVLDLGAADYYVQARASSVGAETEGLTGNVVGVIYRWQDSDNYSRFELDVDAREIRLVDVVAGVASTIQDNPIAPRDDITLGVLVEGTSVVAMVEGVRIFSGTAIQTDETHAGLYALWGASRQPEPKFATFEAWDGLAWDGVDGSMAGVIWTGHITKVHPATVSGPSKVVQVTAHGPLAKAASVDVASPRFLNGEGSGLMVGRALQLAGLLSPPGSTGAIDGGTASLGLITNDDAKRKALDICRGFEATERGFLHERPEGTLAFDAANARALIGTSNTVQAWFSDRPGSQQGFHRIEPLDSQRDIVNQVVAAVAGALPTVGSASSSDSTAIFTPNLVQVTLPTTSAGELIMYLFTSTVATADERWLTPTGWVSHRDAGDAVRQRIYSRVCDGTESGDLVTFYADAGSAGGATCTTLLNCDAGEWFGAQDGIHVAAHVEGSQPPAIIPPWGSAGTTYIATRAGMTSVAGATVSGMVAPLGYTDGVSTFQNGAVQGADCAQEVAFRSNVEPFEAPTTFDGTFAGFEIVESTVIAIRGPNGDPPEPRGFATVTTDNVVSQDEHNEVRTLTTDEVPFADEDAAVAYSEAVLDTYGTTRPIIAISWWATKNAAYRRQAITRRVSDRIHVDADGRSGVGVAGEFFIESLEHTWSKGVKLWEVTAELSPA